MLLPEVPGGHNLPLALLCTSAHTHMYRLTHRLACEAHVQHTHMHILIDSHTHTNTHTNTCTYLHIPRHTQDTHGTVINSLTDLDRNPLSHTFVHSRSQVLSRG